MFPLPVLLFGLLAAPGQDAPPPPPATAAAKPIRVPFRLTETRHVLVRARVNGGRPLNFIVDTGAPALFVSTEAAKEMGVTASPEGWGTLDRLELEGGITVEKIPARVEDPHQLKGMNAMDLAGTQLDGVMGYSLLARFRIELDLTKTAMWWTPVPYTPLPPPTQQELFGDQPVEQPKGAATMENLSKMASQLFPSRGPTPPNARGFLGVELGPGLRVARVLPGSPAAAAGLKAGDRILAAAPPGEASRKLKDVPDALRTLSGVVPGEVVKLSLQRGRRTLALSVHAVRNAL